jgi:hypothetical protein
VIAYRDHRMPSISPCRHQYTGAAHNELPEMEKKNMPPVLPVSTSTDATDMAVLNDMKARMGVSGIRRLYTKAANLDRFGMGVLRLRGSLMLVTILVLTQFAFSQSDNLTATQDPQAAQQRTESTITGCLTGKANEYRLVDQKGTTHLLLNPTVSVESYKGQSVTLTGEPDITRDASASSDEATTHGMRFFRVTGVTGESGPCK